MYLPREDWLHIVTHAPLVSIDLILLDNTDRVLLGWRRNQPAHDCWFVPGGVVRKNETLDTAFARILHAELDLHATRDQARMLGVYEHHYADNFAAAPGISTHYIVLAHELRLADLPATPADRQHTELRAFTVPELLTAPDVHENTKRYFKR